MRLLLILALVLSAGCGQAASGAQQLALGADGIWVARRAVRSIASGAATAEGPPELWLADERGVTTLAADGTATQTWRPPRFARILRLEAMDLDGDGGSEWVVTMVGARVRSLVLGWRDGGWVELAPGRPGFLRPALGPDGTPILMGQSAGSETPFTGPVRLVHLANGELTDGESMDLPPQLAIHEVFWVPQGDAVRMFSLESSGHVGERDVRSARALVWRSDARTVSRPVVVEREYSNLLGEELDGTLDLPTPTVVMDPDGDGVFDVLIVAGSTTPVAVLENVRVLQGGDARLLTLDTRGLKEERRTPLIGRAMVGVVPWTLRGQPVWAAAVWVRADTGFVRPETRVYLFDPATGDLLPPGPVAP